MARDFFQQLRGFSWRGISVPVISTRLTIRQDLAQHKYVGRPGASLEATGRGPLEISAEIPFFNDIEPGPNESWTKGTLYPDAWRKFFAAMVTDTSTGDLVHPELGTLTCKPAHLDTPWVSTVRGGVSTTAQWLETTEDPNALATLIAAISPIAGALQAAQDIDRHLTATVPPFEPPTIPPKPSFTDMMRSIQGVFDQATLMQKRFAGVIDSIKYRVDNILRAMNTAIKSSRDSARIATYWPLRDACDRMTSALVDLKKSLLNGARPIGVYIPGRNATMGKLSADIPTDIVSLMQLNPDLLKKPVVLANSKVRYYLPSAA